MNNNKNHTGALLGVFAPPPGYVGVGKEGEPCEYKDPGSLPRECYKGKQFGTVAPRTGKTNDVYFEKKHPWLAEGDGYVDRWRYLDSQPEKKKGFGTGDFSKRDEFSNTVRTLQWREQLSHEAKWTRAAIEFFASAPGGSVSGGQEGEAGSGGATQQRPAAAGLSLYDRIHEPARGREAPACSRTRRDTANRTALSHERDFGRLTTASRLAFAPPQGAPKRPEHARRPLIRTAFYRRGCPFFPADGGADGGGVDGGAAM